ncbi:tektin-1-like [Lytechinus variegatus]|uniref:tektin-1-like n=1 Tax=Lytechinus variegatus TaxID=7654 RepID=UPI001BB0EC4A|nr:tektin-1-like [Lytechinus variegatus]
MSKLIQAPQRFTHGEWNYSNHANYNSAEKQRASAERLIDESNRLLDETEEATKKTQRDVNKKFEQRLDDVTYWKDELERKLKDSKDEIEMLLAYKTRLQNALEACKEPLDIVNKCLNYREGRVAIDLVHDDVEKNLLKEREVIRGVMALLQKTLDEITEQIRIMRSRRYYLEKDLTDKFGALNIDENCRELRDDNSKIQFKDGVAKIETNSVTPEDWQSFSNENILKAERDRKNSADLRAVVDSLLNTTANDMQQQVDDTNLAFSKRIRETDVTKGKLETHLAKVEGQIREMEENIQKLQKGVDDKMGPKKLSETRLDARTTRPNVELCRDPVQYRLIGEVTEINTNIERLQATLAQAESELKGLIRNQLNLQEDIDIKSRSLNIDDTQCMTLRRSINVKRY